MDLLIPISIPSRPRNASKSPMLCYRSLQKIPAHYWWLGSGPLRLRTGVERFEDTGSTGGNWILKMGNVDLAEAIWSSDETNIHIFVTSSNEASVFTVVELVISILIYIQLLWDLSAIAGIKWVVMQAGSRWGALKWSTVSQSLHGAKDDGMADEPHLLVLLYQVPAYNQPLIKMKRCGWVGEENIWVAQEEGRVTTRGQ